MPYLDTYSTPLTKATAAHLLRRATFGPTKKEIDDFIGLTASQAVAKLIANSNPEAPVPIDLEPASTYYNKPFLGLPFMKTKINSFSESIRQWWVGIMLVQDNNPSVLEKLTAFWQNHFVVSQTTMLDYRLLYEYLQYLRVNCLGSFRKMAIDMSKNGGMLIYQNGNENQKLKPNENYARELQELFVVGEKDFNGNSNYTEDDIKAAARVLTGWQVKNYWTEGSTTVSAVFNAVRHDETSKTFSSKYNNKVITGRAGTDAGDAELNDLIDMLLAHPQSARFICRKLYKWYVNPNVSSDIETNVIVPLANFFVSSSNNYSIQGVLTKLLTSEVFFDPKNLGSMIKSPLEWTIGLIRFFEKKVPDRTSQLSGYRKLVKFATDKIAILQLYLLNQPLVKGSTPYYQFGLTKNWLNVTTIGQRNTIANYLVYPSLEITPGYFLSVDFLPWVTSLQPNFSDTVNTPAITPDVVLEAFLDKLLIFDLSQAQKNVLIDKYMMSNLSRNIWRNDWNRYRSSPSNANYQTVILSRCRPLMSQILSLAEYHLF